MTQENVTLACLHLDYEPFSGSGTQLCAAQATDRICYAMEIEPKYVAVALERLADMGLEPKLATASTVQTPEVSSSC